MKQMPAYVLLIFALMIAACSEELITETPAPTSTTVRRPTQEIKSGEAATTSTPSPLPTASTPTTQTILLNQSFPSDWRLFGDRRFGIQLAAPASWENITGDVRLSNRFIQLGPQILLLVDRSETSVNLLQGNAVGEGMFVLAYIQQSNGRIVEPEQALIEAIPFDISDQIISNTEIHDQTAAYVDLQIDPLNVFPADPNQLFFRFISLTVPGTGENVFMLLGSGSDMRDSGEMLLDEIADTLTFPPTNIRLREPLINNENVKETLEEGVADLWMFNSGEGIYATITLIPNNNFVDLTLNLIGPDGQVIATMDNGYAGDVEMLTDVQLPVNGNYAIEVGEFFNESAAYELNLVLGDEPQFVGGGSIQFGQEITSELPENGEHKWTFEGTAGQTVTIILTSLNDQLDMILEVRGPDGEELAVLDEGFAGDPEVLTGLDLSISGEYVILLRGFAGRGGPYILSLDEGGESTVNFYDAGDISYGESKRELLRADEAHAWFFEGEAGDEVTIEVLPLESNLDMDIWLLDPELRQLDTKDELLSGEPEKIEQSLPVNGVYLVLIREFFGEPGEYEISLDATGGTVLEIAGSISYSQTITGTLPAGKQVGWTFSGRVDEVINVIVSPVEADRDLVLVLQDPRGIPVATIDGSLAGVPEQLEAFRLTSDGRWMIIIQEFFNEGSRYQIQLFRQSIEDETL